MAGAGADEEMDPVGTQLGCIGHLGAHLSEQIKGRGLDLGRVFEDERRTGSLGPT